MYRYLDKRNLMIYSFRQEVDDVSFILLTESQFDFYEKNKDKITRYSEVIDEKIIKENFITQSIESIKKDLLILASAESIGAFNETIEPYVMSNILAGTYKNADNLKIELDNFNKALHSEYEVVKAIVEVTDDSQELQKIEQTLFTRFRDIASEFNFKGEW